MDTINTQPENTSSEQGQAQSPEDKFKFSFNKANLKWVVIALVILALGALAFYNKHLFVAATVDGSIINRLEVIKKLEKQNGTNALEALIENQLIDNAAAKANVTASDDEMDEKISTIKTQIESQGGTFDAALAGAGLTLEDLRTQVALQIKLEKLLGDKITVSDDEVTKYMADNKISSPENEAADTKTQIRDQLKSEKFGAEAGKYLADLRAAAKIKTYVNY